MTKTNKNKNRKLLFRSGYNETYLKASFIGMLFLMMFSTINLSFAVEDVDTYKEGFFSKYWNTPLKDVKLTVLGEELGCSVYPDVTKKLTYSEATNKPLKEIFGSSAYGLVNVYQVIDNTKYIVKEKWVSETYYFSLMPGNKPSSWVLELYNCPVPKSTKSIYTPDGYKNNDLICDHGTSVSRVICKTGYCSEGVKYEEVFECKSGTFCTSDIDDCILSNSDNERTTLTGDSSSSNSYTTSTTTSDDTLKLYETLISQLTNKLYDESAINEKIRSQLEVLNSVKDQVEDDTKKSESSDNVPLSFVFTILGFFSFVLFLVYLSVRKRK